jgi:hypothetical protein
MIGVSCVESGTFIPWNKSWHTIMSELSGFLNPNFPKEILAEGFLAWMEHIYLSMSTAF